MMYGASPISGRSRARLLADDAVSAVSIASAGSGSGGVPPLTSSSRSTALMRSDLFDLQPRHLQPPDRPDGTRWQIRPIGYQKGRPRSLTWLVLGGSLGYRAAQIRPFEIEKQAPAR